MNLQNNELLKIFTDKVEKNSSNLKYESVYTYKPVDQNNNEIDFYSSEYYEVEDIARQLSSNRMIQFIFIEDKGEYYYADEIIHDAFKLYFKKGRKTVHLMSDEDTNKDIAEGVNAVLTDEQYNFETRVKAVIEYLSPINNKTEVDNNDLDDLLTLANSYMSICLVNENHRSKTTAVEPSPVTVMEVK